GGKAAVVLAEQTSLQRYVAVKVMKPSLMQNSGQDMLARFKQEAMMAAGLNHPNIVQVYTIGQEENLHYIAQEYVQGKDLASILRERGKPDLSSALHIMRQVAAALKASGQAGIVHRDIKPENILVTKKGEVKVADFGLAQLGDSSTGERSNVTMGTPLYMSPEQVSGRELDPRSDVYSFGVTCFQLLSGETPFKGNSPVQIAMQHLKNPPPSLKQKNPTLPDVLCRMVHRMMAKRRSLRYQSADEVLEDLKKLITAHKQSRSLDLVRLPRLEELEKMAEEERARVLKQGSRLPEGVVDDFGLEMSPTAEVAETKVMSSRWAAEQPVVVPETKVLPPPVVNDDDDAPAPPKKRSAPPSDGIDLTPAVDVTFQLLIFFMVTASFSMQKAFDVPPAKTNEGVSAIPQVEVPLNGVKVQVDAENSVYVETKKATDYRDVLELLQSEKTANKDITDLDLELDPESTHEMRVMVIDAATQSGFTRVRNKIVPYN
ncbi:MAG: protein kinase domain-containing protein, partial [Planctomycetota bacterium]